MAVLVFAALAAGLAWTAYDDHLRHVMTEATLRARGAAADVDRYVQSRWSTLQAIAAAPSVRAGDLLHMREYFEDLGQASFDAGISWIDPAGWMQVRNGGYSGPPIDFSDREHVRQALETGRPSVSSAFIGTINQAPIVAFAVPVFDDLGQLVGLLAGGIRLDAVSIGADDLRYAGGTNVVVLDRLGQLVAGSRPVETIVTADPAFPFAAMAEAGQGARTSVVAPDGAPDQVIGYASAPSAGWLVLVQRPEAMALGGARVALTAQLLGIALAATLAIMVLLWAARRLEQAARAEEETLGRLQTAVAALQKRETLRDAFVGVMSHELRTPVTTIYGAAKLLRRAPRRPELETLVVDIEEEAERLHRITEDLLVLSRAERGLIEIRPEPVLLQRVVPLVVSDIIRRFPEAAVAVDVSSSLPPISGEVEPFRQVLGNLLTNAVKYGAGSEISVTASQEGEHVRLEVADGGPGVPSDQRERIFDLFYRGEATAKQASGTGIGLFVVRQLVEAMGGTVEVVQRVGPGTTFVVSLRPYPADAVDASPAEDVGPAVVRAIS